MHDLRFLALSGSLRRHSHNTGRAHPEVTVFPSHRRFDDTGTFTGDEITEGLLHDLTQQHQRAALAA
ncbi:hypothetical protein [Streptomyces spectabilis]|uniref:Uncharacterized protein n=1 Tax=Streptomyces spectabilis TaxID=68270 RepID=A0A5P2WZP6_STRST|nr:hypothetical protein [Streptomyces spectabilis]MBB5101527.1 hypothetical protein [Streptomyces spectabilis]MCI3900716.1 hypothetical protein [Streptomyces spectabilis]QEV58257.1 hypothetical protein CP982_05645 [Streptomyces spectabilis]GGV11952.1 hypothetical protein GCM10010245_22110 [Streptomyces spectabilis]